VKTWIEKYTFIEEVRCEDLASQFGMISLVGAESAALFQTLFDWSVHDLPAQHARLLVHDEKSIIVQRSGLITPVQFNLIMPAAELENFWQALITQATPLGHAAYEMLRIHRGLPATDKEITDEYNPHEVGLFPFINFEKGCYIGQEVIARLDTYQKVQRQLAGVRLEMSDADDRLFSATPAPIYVGEQLAGQLTSACFSPALGKGIGLTVIRKQFAAQADPLQVRWPERAVSAHLQLLPFKTDN
jgi:folate-binding protein YgfZ